jgi:C-terminal processing protease CtpA/Prc
MRSFAAAVLLFAFGVASAAQSPAPAPKAAEEVRVQRLAALGRAWGHVRYAHPALATRDIDWDQALFDAIPRVDAARNDAEFRDALSRMLAVLHDPATHLLDAGPSAAATHKPLALPATDGVVVYDLAASAGRAQAAGSSAAVHDEAGKLAAAAAKAKVLVIDARADLPPGEDYATAAIVMDFLTQSGPKPLRLGALRYRSYSGYPSQQGDAGSGGYSVGLKTELPREVAGAGVAPLPPLVLVTNARSAVSAEAIAGLQAAGLVWLVAGDDVDALGATAVPVELGKDLAMQIRQTEVVAPDGQVGIVADYAQVAEAVADAMRGARPARSPAAARALQLRSDADRPYASDTLPPREQRLLALFRFWNVMQRFFPYRHLIGPSWDDVLERYIPQFDANRDLADYQLTLRKLVAESHDSHVGVRTPMLASAERLGRHQPPVLLRFIENQTVVAAVLAKDVDLRVGDVVQRIDGKPIEEARAYTGQYVSASAPQTWQRDLHRNLLRGQAGSSVALDVRGLDGKTRHVEVKRSVPPEDNSLGEAEFKPRPQPVFGVLPSGIGYVDLDRLTPAQVDEMFIAIAGTKATIFDMRGYPHGTAWTIAPRLGTRDQPVGALFRRPLVEGVEGEDLSGAMVSFEQRLPKATGAPYLGKVVMLVNEYTQSQAEHTGLFFEAATDVTFIGTPTAGANGDVTRMVLPGGYAVSFSGHDVRHADGRQLQRLGLQPQVRAAPTIAGLARGEDEVLATAERWLREHPR